MVQKINKLAIGVQANSIRNMFPGTAIHTVHDQSLSWTHTITPSPLGDMYKIKLVYDIADRPKVYVVHPNPLLLAKDCTRLPHCYSTEKQHLCLYYPDGREWNKSMLLTKTIIPWTYEWLYHYEIWLGTDKWHGGGTTHDVKTEIKKNLV